MVGTGNRVPLALSTAYADLPDNQLLDDADIRRMLPDGFHLQERRKYQAWIINQGSLGKCNASAAAGAEYRIRDAAGMEHVALADNYLYWHINSGKDQGSMLDDGMDFVTTKGICPRTLKTGIMPHDVYHVRQVSAAMRAEADSLAPQYRTHEPWRIPLGANFARAIASCLARRQPVIMAWHVGNDSMKLRGGYIQQARGPGNHACFFHSAKFVGGQDIVHPDLCNSWGPTADGLYGPQTQGWGEGGYGLMTMASAAQCSGNHVFYALTSVVDSLPSLKGFDQ